MFDPLPVLAVSVMWKGYVDSDWFGQAIVIVQILISIAAWSIMIGKWRELKTLTRDTARFVKSFVNGQDVLDFYLQRRKSTETPMETIYGNTCERLVKILDPEARRQLIGRINDIKSAALTRREIELLTSTAEHTLSEQILRLEHGMTPLATAVSSAPMLGLFGTVWGIMVAFQAMGVKGSAMLSELAPGISSALLTTVVGLLVAIPSTIGYNILHSRVKKMTVDCEGFTDELMGRIACELQGRDD